MVVKSSSSSSGSYVAHGGGGLIVMELQWFMTMLVAENLPADSRASSLGLEW